MAENEAPAPRLSDETIAEYRTLLTSKDFETRFPDQHAALAESVGRALAETNQQLLPAGDPRSPAQQLHDRQHGLTRDAAGKVQLPPILQAVVDREGPSTPSDLTKLQLEVWAAHVAKAEAGRPR